MKKILIIIICLSSIGIGSAQSIDAYLETCVLRDTMFIDVMVIDNATLSFPLGGANFVFDIVDPASDVATSSIDWSAKTRIDSAEGPWDDSGAGDYFDMELNTGNFINLTIVPDESNSLDSGSNTGTVIPTIATRVARIALPVLLCGDTVSIRWRYRNRVGGHTWLGSNLNMGVGTYSAWNFGGVDSTKLFSFLDLENVILCNNLCSSQPISAIQYPDSLCYNDFVTFKVPDAAPGDSIYWFVNGVLTQSGTTDSLRVNATSNDTVWAQVANNGCVGCPTTLSNQLFISLLSTDSMMVFAGNDTTINEGDPIDLNGAEFGTTLFFWSPGQFLSDSLILNPAATLSDTTVFIIYGYGLDPKCFVTDTVVINVIENVLEVTNLFTPNGDGVNDNWTVNDLDEVANCKVSIYSRWGIKVFEAEPYMNDWDGTENGKQLPGGAYYYVFQCSDRDKPIVGSITLVR